MLDKIIGLGKGLIAPVAKVYEKREDRKKAVAVIQAQTAKGTAEGETEIKLKNSEWELISKRSETDTWKDEYITIVVTSPIVMIILGGIQSAFGFGEEMLNAVSLSLTALESAGVELGPLMLYTVLAALGIKMLK